MMRTLLLVTTLLGLAAQIAQSASSGPSPEMLDKLSGRHPRILLSEEDFSHIANREWDALGHDYRAFLTRSGERMLDQEPVAYQYVGRRLLQHSQRVLKRVMTLSLLYRIEGKTAYRDQAIRELEAAAAFPSWNPAHYLDVGELALAVAIGTDWLWDDLTEAQRTRFLTALKEKALLPSLDEDHPDNWWIYYYNNWNPVCHAGLTAGAILLAETEPELASKVITRAIRAFPYALESYQPSGAYPEGPSYWTYGTEFSAILINLLETAFATDFGLDGDPGFIASGTYRALAITPTGKFYNYSDSGETSLFTVASVWFASRYRDPSADLDFRGGLDAWLKAETWDPGDNRDRLMPFVALWYPEPFSPEEKMRTLPNFWLGKGANPVALIRDKWGDPNAAFLGFKGGDGSVSHAHLDSGSFIFEDQGVRWAIDLGSQNYTKIEQAGLGLWDRRPHSDRWRVFRLGSFSHNQVLIDQRQQLADKKADITRLESLDGCVHGTVDLSPVYANQATSFVRDFRLFNDRVLEITDTITGARERTDHEGRKSATLRWRMLTRAEVTIDGGEALLRQDGKCLLLKVAEPATFTLRAGPVDPPPYYWDEPNPGVSAIDIWTNANDAGDQVIRVLMTTDPAQLEQHLSN